MLWYIYHKGSEVGYWWQLPCCHPPCLDCFSAWSQQGKKQGERTLLLEMMLHSVPTNKKNKNKNLLMMYTSIAGRTSSSCWVLLEDWSSYPSVCRSYFGVASSGVMYIASQKHGMGHGTWGMGYRESVTLFWCHNWMMFVRMFSFFVSSFVSFFLSFFLSFFHFTKHKRNQNLSQRIGARIWNEAKFLLKWKKSNEASYSYRYLDFAFQIIFT